MAITWPAKNNFATGDVLTATQMNNIGDDLNDLNTRVTAAGGFWKNPILNSNMSVWQRGTSVAVSAGSSAYTADRWYLSASSLNNMTISRQATGDTTNLPNIQYCARVQRNSTSAGTGAMNFAQSFETINSIPFAGKTVTYSFYARAGANYSSGALTVYLVGGTGTDQNWVTSGYTGQSIPVNSTATLTTTWQRFTFTGSIASTVTELTALFQFTPTGVAGANDYFEITGLQLEVGSSATSYYPNGNTYQEELAACQRYYWRWNASSVFSNVGTGMASSTTIAPISVVHPVPMRVPVTAIEGAGVSTMRLFDWVSGYTATAVSIEIAVQDIYKTTLNVTVASGLTQYRPYWYGANNTTSAYTGFSAEL